MLFRSQIMPNAFDKEMADYAKKQLKAAGMRVLTATSLKGITGEAKAQTVITDNGTLPADLVILAIGVRPATEFLENSKLKMFKGTILVDAQMRTSLPDIYAVGDCAMVQNAQTGKSQWSAMGSTANLAARAMAKALNGLGDGYGGCFGTGVVRLLPKLTQGAPD